MNTTPDFVKTYDRLRASMGAHFDAALFQEHNASIVPMLAAITARADYRTIQQHVAGVAAISVSAHAGIRRYRELHGADARHRDAAVGLCRLFGNAAEARLRIDRMIAAGVAPLAVPAHRIDKPRGLRRIADALSWLTRTREHPYQPPAELVEYVQAARELRERDALREQLPQSRRLLAFATAAAEFGRREAQEILDARIERQAAERARETPAPARSAHRQSAAAYAR